MKHFLFTSFILIYTSMALIAQQSQPDSFTLDPDTQKQVLEAGAWLISKTEGDFDAIGKVLSKLMQQKIIPQAIDRNLAGELLIISQFSPPALFANKWYLGVYESETEMMESMESLAKEGWTPTAMDVQHDAAFVLYVFSEENLIGARLIKVQNIDELSNAINVYYNLGYLPSAISTFKDTLWILFSIIHEQDISRSDVLVRIIEKDDTAKSLVKELSNSDISLIDVCFTVNNKVIMLYHQKNVESPTQDKNNTGTDTN